MNRTAIIVASGVVLGLAAIASVGRAPKPPPPPPVRVCVRGVGHRTIHERRKDDVTCVTFGPANELGARAKIDAGAP